jgi:hypothetical protein
MIVFKCILTSFKLIKVFITHSHFGCNLEIRDLVDKPGLFAFKTHWGFSYPILETSQLEIVDLAISNWQILLTGLVIFDTP